MYKLDFNKPCKIHFTGIGGISMSGLAQILLSRGFTVTGSDSKLSPITDELEAKGATVFLGQRYGNISKDTTVLVYTAAVNHENPELVAASDYNIPTLTRAELLGQIMKNYKLAIGVAGTHGKTTTTSMISQILLEYECDPTILVGGIMPAIDGNIRIGHSQNFITEACEYTNSFLSFAPTIGVILNIKEDHLDFFKDINDIRHSFKKYAELLPSDGALIINNSIENIDYITGGLACKVVTYSIDDHSCMFSADNVSYNNLACGCFDLLINGNPSGRVNLKLPGVHNVSNALAAAAAAVTSGIPVDTVIAGLNHSSGTKRRFEYKGDLCGVTVIDDYAHHPDEIRATLTTAANYKYNSLWCVFQPHTYSRTFALLDEFADALKLADKVVLADIHAARETNTIGITSKDLQKKLIEKGVEAYYFPSFDEIENFLLKNCINGDLLITMGAGDVVNIGENLLGI